MKFDRDFRNVQCGTYFLVTHVLEKLSVKDRTQAATVALQRGIIALE